LQFDSPLTPGVLERRYKRFLADIVLDDGSRITAHCPNTGSMLGCDCPGSRVWLSRSDNPKRKYPWTWELVESETGSLVGIHTGRSNALVREALEAGLLPELGMLKTLRAEVRFGREHSRVDFVAEFESARWYLEVKNVTAAVNNRIALFPDAISARGTRHLRELMGVIEAGHRAAVLFCTQRSDVDEVRPADLIDRVYGSTLRQALACGVTALALGAEISPSGIVLTRRLPVVCPEL
jgi:sugar fermentation stimulation protein A